MPDIAIGYVHSGQVAEKWHRSVLAALSADKGRHLSTVIGESPANIAEARCDVVQHFLERDEEWLWWLDTDIVFSPDTHLKLLEAADRKERPIVSAAYYAEWDGQASRVWAVWRDDQFKSVTRIPEGVKLVQLAAIGMGCCLVHRTVFETIRAHEKFGQDPWIWFANDPIVTPEGGRRLGEDFTFCARAQMCGFPIYGLDHTVGHLKTVLLDDTSVREAVAA